MYDPCIREIVKRLVKYTLKLHQGYSTVKCQEIHGIPFLIYSVMVSVLMGVLLEKGLFACLRMEGLNLTLPGFGGPDF